MVKQFCDTTIGQEIIEDFSKRNPPKEPPPPVNNNIQDLILFLYLLSNLNLFDKFFSLTPVISVLSQRCYLVQTDEQLHSQNIAVHQKS